MTDVIIVGGGIVGLSAAAALAEAQPGLSIKLLEKESTWGSHQTRRNSGVIHSGIYYRPGSLKAKLARAGNKRMIQFCRDQGIAHEVCGKVIVATDQDEIPSLDRLEERAKANGVTVERLTADQLRKREPHARGVAALLVPDAGIVDYQEVANELARVAAHRGVELHLETRLESIERSQNEIRLGAGTCSFSTRFLINCAGLHSDSVAEWDDASIEDRVLPFRGDYFSLKTERSHLVRHLIYPVPDPRFPFLGVHLTRSIHGGVHVGPNAVLAMSREGYGRGAFNFSDARKMVSSEGFWNYARKNWRHGLSEAGTAINKKAFARRLQRLVPEIKADDLVVSESGVRAQAVNPRGELLDDFKIVVGRDSLHVCNAASPAATASLELGRYVAEQAVAAAGFPATSRPVEGWTEPMDSFCSGLCEI